MENSAFGWRAAAHIRRSGRLALGLIVGILLAACGSRAVTLPAASADGSSSGSAAPSAVQMSSIYPPSRSPASYGPIGPLPATENPLRTAAASRESIAPGSIGALHWSQLSGESSQVAVAPDGSIWALSDQPKGSVNKNIWHYVNGTWKSNTGVGACIAVGPTGTVYIVNGTSGGVDAYNGSSWSYLGGGARCLTTGADGSVYILSNANIINGNSAIWKYAGGKWTQQPGSGSLLARSYDPATYTVPGVGRIVPNGYFLVNSSGATYYYSPGVGYVQFPGTSSGVAAVTGGLFELNYPASPNGEGLAYLDYATALVSSQTGTGVSIASGPGSGGSGTQLDEVTSSDLVWTTPIVAAVAFNDYPTFGYDNAHDVFNPNSTAISPASFPNLHLAWQAALDNGSDFSTQTQPILATEIAGHSGVLFVAGSSGNVYAYDATTGALMWTKNLGQLTFTCGPSYTGTLGVGGTVAYDPPSRSLYVLGNSNASPGTYGQNTLYHLDAATGTVLGSVNVSGAAAGPTELDLGHTSVTLAGGTAYVGTGSFCDISSWRGRVVAISVPSMTVENTFFTLWDPQNQRGQGAQAWGGGGVWGWGGVAVDPVGNVLTAVGNADAGGNYGQIEPPFVQAPTEYSGYAEAVVQLNSNLSTVLASNHPVPQSVYGYANDVDEQGTPMVFTPTGCPTMVAVQGKAGQLSMYEESTLASGPIVQYQMSPSSGSDYFIGEPAYSPATGLVYSDVIASTAPSLFSPGLVAVNPGCGTPAVTWQAAFGSASNWPRSVPATSAGGVVFAAAGGAMWALNASTGAILNNGGPFLHTGGAIRMPATVDGDWVFVLDNNGDLYGLTTDPSFPSIKAHIQQPTARQRQSIWPEKTRTP